MKWDRLFMIIFFLGFFTTINYAQEKVQGS